MLNTVRMLRRLLRNAFLGPNRVNVIGDVVQLAEAGRRRQARPGPPRIDEGVRYRQPGRIEFLNRSKSLDSQDLPLHIFDTLADTLASSFGSQVEIVIRAG